MTTSPSPQCAKRREVVTDPGPTPEVNLPALAQEVHRLHAQSTKDAVLFDETHDQINDHAACLLLLKKQILHLHNSVVQVSKDVLTNDAELKEKLKGLETIVTTQRVDTKQLLDKPKQSIQKVASYAATKGPGPMPAEASASAEAGPCI